MKKLYFVLLSAFLLISATACDQLTGKKSDSPVIAKIGDAEITVADFNREISRVPEWARDQFKGEEGKKKFFDELVKKELIYLEAKDMKLDNSKEFTEQVEDFKKRTLVSLILQKEVENKSSVNEADVKAFFDQNKDRFMTGSKIRAKHILVKTEEEANDILERINKGEKFSELAKELSLDKGSAKKGGDLGYFGQGRMVPEFEQAALRLEPGEISKPVKTRFGYHIIQMVDIKKGKPATFEQSRESIRKQLITDKRKQLFDSYIEKLKSEKEIKINEQALSSVTLPWENKEKQEAGTETQH